ncbi:MAG: preprotein translocase subunit Sec61beta [Clostridia bacterium]|nr:preprotein translocase subunit Sec61beta [Clostridia bacterium]
MLTVVSQEQASAVKITSKIVIIISLCFIFSPFNNQK